MSWLGFSTRNCIVGLDIVTTVVVFTMKSAAAVGPPNFCRARLPMCTHGWTPKFGTSRRTLASSRLQEEHVGLLRLAL